MEPITAGPRRTPGVKDRDELKGVSQRDVEEFRREAAPEEPEPKKEPEKKTGVLELSQEQTTAVNLVLTRVQLAAAEHKLAMHALKDAQMKLLQTSREEAVVLARISQRCGIPRIKSVKVAGPNSIAYETE